MNKYLNLTKGQIKTRMKYVIPKNILFKEYITKKRSQEDIAKEFKVSQWLIGQRLHSYKIKSREKTWKLNPRKYYVNHKFFDVINTTNAWVLGWILSDGFINKNTNAFGIKINKKDKDILLKIKELINYSGKILTTKTYLKITNKSYNHLLLKISSQRIVKRLNSLGIYHGKTKKELFIEQIKKSNNEEIIKSFIKGIFEGNGSIVYTKNSLLFQIVGTKELLLDIQLFLMKYLGLGKTKLTRNIQKGNNWLLRYRGNKQALNIFNWLYSNNRLHLNRKYKKYLRIKRILEK